MAVVGGRKLQANGYESLTGTISNKQGGRECIQMPGVVVVPGLGRCLFSSSAVNRAGIYTVLDSTNPRLMAKNENTSRQEGRGLYMLDVRIGGGGEENISAATSHVRLGYVNAAEQEKLDRKEMGIEYSGQVARCDNCVANKSRQPQNKDTDKRGKTCLSLVFTDIKGPV